MPVSKFHEITQAHKTEFLEKGYEGRYFFPHNLYYLPKLGPDGLKMSQRLWQENDPNKSWELILYADSSLTNEFPEELFFDNDIIWHQQQAGKSGQIATANLMVSGDTLYCYNFLSDLVQRISRRKEFKSRIENRFKGWSYMLFNGVLNFAIDKNLKYIFSPTANLVFERSSRNRDVKRELFDRVYDRTLQKNFNPVRQGKWWVVEVAHNKNKVVRPEQKQENMPTGKTICICHDIERGLGHIGIDQNLVQEANATASQSLSEMLGAENALSVNATYNVVGSFLNEVRPQIDTNGHCLAFHSYDHIIPGKNFLGRASQKVYRALKKSGIKLNNQKLNQLSRCRKVDYRLKGYRPPRSLITSELTDSYLGYQNFEWLASSKNSLGIETPQLQNRIVKIPVTFGDFKMYKHGIKFEDWQNEAIDLIEKSDFIAICLHDCYSKYWLTHYRTFLEKIRGLGTFKTFNEVSNEILLSNSI